MQSIHPFDHSSGRTDMFRKKNMSLVIIHLYKIHFIQMVQTFNSPFINITHNFKACFFSNLNRLRFYFLIFDYWGLKHWP